MMLVLVFFALTGTTRAIPSSPPSLSLLSSYSVNEGQTIALQCSVTQYSSKPDPITWYWVCDNDDLTAKSTDDGGGTSTLRFSANRKYDKQYCYCRAVSHDSSNTTYDKTSSYRTIAVYYTPLSSPILNTSKVSLGPGEEAVLGCSIDSIGNPAISWSWKCGTRTINTRVQRRGLTTDVVIPAEQGLDGLSCYCSAGTSTFQASSKPALVTVSYIPTDYPKISRTAVTVSVGSPVVLRCSLSSAGNPPVTWSWLCNDVIVNKGVNRMGKSTELSFLAEQEDDRKRCYCRAKNPLFSIAGQYDEKSSDSYIKITGMTTVRSVRQSEKAGIPPVAFGVTLAFLLLALVTCLVIIVIQHKRIPKESSLTTWFLLKIGKQSNLGSQIPDTKCTLEEHNYEVLKSNQSKDADERVPTYQNLRLKRSHKQRPDVAKKKGLSVNR